MTFKLIAIGILALLGLSSVMNPRVFRIFLSGLAALCLALFLGVIVVADREQTASTKPSGPMAKIVSSILTALGQEPHWEEIAKTTVDTVEGEVSSAKNRDLEELARKGSKFKVARITDEMRRMTPAERLSAIYERYLEFEFKPKNKGPGIDRLTAKHLDPRLLKAVPIRQQPNGKWDYVVGFVEDEFAREARRSGRKLEVLERLEITAIAAAAIGAILFIAYGTLKVVNTRYRVRSDSDYLAASSISMV